MRWQGDLFYVITYGFADVLLYDPEDPLLTETVLATLCNGDCFGEKALLEDAPRAASIVATGMLYAACISRAEFESVLGKPLSEFKFREKGDNEVQAYDRKHYLKREKTRIDLNACA